MRNLIYLSFSYSENEYRDELREILLSDIRLQKLFWDDKLLPSGEDWRVVMNDKVSQTRIMIMLVSPRYLDKRCQAWTYEIPQALKAHDEGKLTVLWVPTRAIQLSDVPFSHIQATHALSKPLESLSYQDRQAVYERIKQQIIEKLPLLKESVFDVFLSHNSKDKPAIKEIGNALKQRGFSVWLDEWELRPGCTWIDAIEGIISSCKSSLVFVGQDGLGPWEEPEMQALLRRFVKEKKSGNILPVIPVLLPDAPNNVELPLFLEGYTWVDLRNQSLQEGLDRIQWGITGVKP